MAVTLTNGGTTVDLPDAIYWMDEDWSPVVQVQGFSVDSAQILEEWPPKDAGRPITLGGRAAVITYALLKTLRTWLTATNDLELNWRGTPYSVRWRHADKPIEAAPMLLDLPDPSDEDLYRVTLRFVTV